MDAEPSGKSVKEYVIIAGHQQPKNPTFLGRFPLGVPDLSSTNQWVLKRQDQDSSGGGPAWLLEDKPGHTVHKGTVGDLSDNVGYFTLAHQGSSRIEAIPVEKWYNFRPVVQHEVPCLEDAEELMKKGKRPHIAKSITDKLIRSAPAAPDPLPGAAADRKADSEDSEFDEEREYRPKKKPTASSKVRTPADKNDNVSSGDEGPVDAQPDTWKPVGVEDWEYEEDVADDDLNMGEVDMDDEAEAEMRKFIGSDSSSEDPEETKEEELDESAKRIKKLLKKTEVESESDKDEDIDDLDEMAKGASEILDRATLSRANKNAPETSKPKDKIKEREAPKEANDNQRNPKRQKSSVPSKHSRTKDSKAQATRDGPKSIETPEIVKFLRTRGPMPLEELIAAFKKIIDKKEDHQKFIGRVKKLATFVEYPENSGKKAVVLRKIKEK